MYTSVPLTEIGNTGGWPDLECNLSFGHVEYDRCVCGVSLQRLGKKYNLKPRRQSFERH